MASTYDWRTIDFTPAPVGWRAVYLAKDGEPMVTPVAGWLTQEQTRWSLHGEWLPSDEPAERHVVAADHEGAELMAVDDADNFWRLLAPGDPEPTQRAGEVELREREESRESLDARRRERAEAA